MAATPRGLWSNPSPSIPILTITSILPSFKFLKVTSLFFSSVLTKPTFKPRRSNAGLTNSQACRLDIAAAIIWWVSFG